MKTLIKTITIVSIATLTTANSHFNFSSRFNSSENDTTSTIDIRFPAEEHIFVSNELTYHPTTGNTAGTLTELVKFIPTDHSSDIDFPVHEELQSEIIASTLLINDAAEQTIEELIHFTPLAIEFNEQSLIEDLISFKPATIEIENIVEPTSVEELIKFTPREISNEEIVEPLTDLDVLIKFIPSDPAMTEIEKPTIEELVKFNLNEQVTTTIVEPLAE
ncbi:hypothetical protein [Solitalea canadensis]|uniref:Uncharacterized protein n=1 Tax=Solitalea canadensis (strain ATCC 29591 / DSM 3403 / JCM 21819 / LMG 8368 / NBRC 15130 / NCIMB 12057 / USAM 9D) TaxID=929556 RepID=H8KXR1_SOLCM|nr:hypothetical protein [Solitalea canadensis]AFD05476.1 hypothetical protein Solca_0333 [Solitalea canadensis DSM 3403]